MTSLSITKDRNFYRKLLHLTVPIAFQSLMLAAVAAADAMMLGSVEQNSMAAVSLATQIQFIQNMILSSVVAAASILGAQYWGKGDTKSMNDVFCMSLRLNGVTSMLFFVGCVFYPRYLMLLLTNEEVLIQDGIRYLQIAGWSYLLTGVSQCYLTMMKVTDHPAMTAKISTLAVLMNIALNAVLIFGLFGLPALGISGAAWATLIARIAELVLVVVISMSPGYLRPNLKGLLHRSPM